MEVGSYKRMKKTLSVVLVLSVTVVLVSAFVPVFVHALTQPDVEAICLIVGCDSNQRSALTALVTQTSSSACPALVQPLTLGSRGQAVSDLQTYLVDRGHLAMPAGVAKGYFGPLTQAALAKWQAASGVSPAVGYFGSISLAKYNSVCVVSGSGGSSSTGNTSSGDTGKDSTLKGGAGSLDDVDYISSLNNEEVGEDEEDVEVAGLEVEADSGSDLMLRAVTVNFSQGTADRKFTRYADEVSVWLDGEEFARVDADRFTDNNNYTRAITLEKGAIIRAGKVGDLIVAISGVRSLDSNDETETWTLEFESIRYEDASGAIIVDSTTGDINDGTGRTFSFERFATSANVELKVKQGDDDINNARVIDVDDSSDTDNVEVLSFGLEVKGKSDVTIDDMHIRFVTVGADLDEVANTARIIANGKVIGTESIPASATTTSLIFFDNIDWTLEAGDTVDVVVELDINDLGGNFTEGDTLQAFFGEAETDNSLFDAEDETGEDLAGGDKTGSESSDAHSFYDSGIQVKFISKSDSKNFIADESGESDQVTFKFVFDVEAFGADMYIERELVATDTITAGTDGHAYATTSQSTTGTTTVSATISAAQSDSDDTAASYIIDEDDTRRFTISIVSEADIDGAIQMQIHGIKWDTDAGDAHANSYTFNLNDFLSEIETVNRI